MITRPKGSQGLPTAEASLLSGCPPAPHQWIPYRYGDHSAVREGCHHHLLEDVFLPGGRGSCWLTSPVDGVWLGFGGVGPRLVAQLLSDPSPSPTPSLCQALVLIGPTRFPALRGWTQPVGSSAPCVHTCCECVWGVLCQGVMGVKSLGSVCSLCVCGL